MSAVRERCVAYGCTLSAGHVDGGQSWHLTGAGQRFASSPMKPDITDLPASVFRSTYDPPDTTLVKSTRPATCAVCRQDVTASIVLPDEMACCERCTGIALRNMIDDAAALRGTR